MLAVGGVFVGFGEDWQRCCQDDECQDDWRPIGADWDGAGAGGVGGENAPEGFLALEAGCVVGAGVFELAGAGSDRDDERVDDVERDGTRVDRSEYQRASGISPVVTVFVRGTADRGEHISSGGVIWNSVLDLSNITRCWRSDGADETDYASSWIGHGTDAACLTHRRTKAVYIGVTLHYFTVSLMNGGETQYSGRPIIRV